MLPKPLGRAADDEPWLIVDGCRLHSRLILGIEQLDSPETIRDVLTDSMSELLIITVDPSGCRQGLALTSILDHVADLNLNVVGTTCHASADTEAVLIARLLRESLDITLVKLDVRPDADRSLPDTAATISAAQVLLRDGFSVIPMIQPDTDAAVELQERGCCALRLMAGRIRSGLGVTNLDAMLAVKAAVTIPCIGEGGIATVADAALIMQHGLDAVLVNTAITRAGSPRLMAKAMKEAVDAGRLGYLARRTADH
jgi:thiazole synthase